MTAIGGGLNDDELANAFEPFYRLPSTQGEGSGLGLAIAQEAATRIGGLLELRNRTDAPGAVYRFSQAIG
jgi:two-component system OmpR family sensor kinase